MVTKRRQALWVAAIAGILVGACSSPTARLTAQPTISDSSLQASWTTDLPDGSIVHYEIWPGDLGQEPTDSINSRVVNGDLEVVGGRLGTTVDISTWPAGQVHLWAAFDPGPSQPKAALDRFGVDGRDLNRPGVVDNYGVPRLLEIKQIDWSGP